MQSKLYQARDGTNRLWLEPEDIELMIETELSKARLFPTTENPIVDIEAFIERHLGARMDQHAQLEPRVLGQTEFFPGRAPMILINKDLTGAAMDDDESAPGLVGRWRATLAHEASHVIMHRFLFEFDEKQVDLLPGSKANPQPQRLMRCYKPNVLFRNGGNDWREVQANRGMASLLMPRTLFRQIARTAIVKLGFNDSDLRNGTASSQKLAAEVASQILVSKQAAGIRLATVGILNTSDQERLELQ